MITQKEWKEKYGKFIWSQIDASAYKQALRQVKKVFPKELISKKEKRTIILDKTPHNKIDFSDPESTQSKMLYIVDNLLNDFIIIPKNKRRMFIAAGVGILTTKSKEFLIRNWGAGEVKNKNGIHSIKDIYYKLRNYLSTELNKNFMVGNDKISQTAKRKEFLNKLKTRLIESSNYDECVELTAQIASVEKRIREDKSKTLTVYEADSIVSRFENNRPINRWIEISYDTRKIASQSTKTPWRSCMNLDDGENVHYVATGIAAGVFVAFLRNKKTSFGRILFKPYVGLNNNNQPVYRWKASKIYSCNRDKRENVNLDLNKFVQVAKNHVDSIYKPLRVDKYVMVHKVYNDHEPFGLDASGGEKRIRSSDYKKIQNLIKIKDFNNFESHLKLNPNKIIDYFKEVSDYINRRFVKSSTINITPDIFQKYLDDMKNSFSVEGNNLINAYIEIFEFLFGEDFQYSSIVELANTSRWYRKYSDIKYITSYLEGTPMNLTARYRSYVESKSKAVKRIIEKYNVSPYGIRRLYESEFEVNTIAQQCATLITGEHSLDIRHLTLEQFVSFEKTNPILYEQMKNLYTSNCINNQQFYEYDESDFDDDYNDDDDENNDGYDD